MVQIFIRKENDIDEWFIIELQGELESKSNSTLSGSFVGDLHYTKDNVPIFIIGHHILYGKVVDMDKPLAVLFKKVMENKSEDLKEDVKPKTEYIVRAVIKKKIVFKTRPKPIITNVPKKI